ncbi:hypothetical protein CWI39_2142p0020 [Hamiltosporidium magnivora]|nr:hypothetical protein LUQ84_000197 [Hamiltosporidium tvaerminnensis]TBT99109.1 hypothetical protein CWI39_2142p0020 [Hamiltosporidium magnivora]
MNLKKNDLDENQSDKNNEKERFLKEYFEKELWKKPYNETENEDVSRDFGGKYSNGNISKEDLLENKKRQKIRNEAVKIISENQEEDLNEYKIKTEQKEKEGNKNVSKKSKKFHKESEEGNKRKLKVKINSLVDKLNRMFYLKEKYKKYLVFFEDKKREKIFEKIKKLSKKIKNTSKINSEDRFDCQKLINKIRLKFLEYFSENEVEFKYNETEKIDYGISLSEILYGDEDKLKAIYKKNSKNSN